MLFNIIGDNDSGFELEVMTDLVEASYDTAEDLARALDQVARALHDALGRLPDEQRTVAVERVFRTIEDRARGAARIARAL